ncbi:hypothetical protein J2W56_001994 [Nocardia kruczakiae]|uniref:Uncharacterized protein n=1 Tax=Nocardia kruczakiae TaxID=261477 RepID=A0ABU1XCI8_9NOCA|nr:hypothetical protein [Nocardia kruczakiae]
MEIHRQAGVTVSMPSTLVVQQRSREVLDHFEVCPECGYAAHAYLTTTYYADGRTTVTTRGTCGLPCGWSGPTEVRKMTGPTRREPISSNP